MDLEIIILSEVSLTEKDKYDIAYMWNLKKWYKWTYLQKEIVTDVENNLMVTRGEKGEWDELGD